MFSVHLENSIDNRYILIITPDEYETLVVKLENTGGN